VEIPAQVALEQLFKVRLTLYVGAASAEAVARSPERPTHPLAGPPGSADLNLRRPLAGNFVQRCGRLPGLGGALQPHGAASGCARCRRLFESFRGKNGGGDAGGAAATFLASAPLRGEEGCGGAACSTPTATSAPVHPELVCRVEV